MTMDALRSDASDGRPLPHGGRGRLRCDALSRPCAPKELEMCGSCSEWDGIQITLVLIPQLWPRIQRREQRVDVNCKGRDPVSPRFIR